jgi:hypothetical protein
VRRRGRRVLGVLQLDHLRVRALAPNAGRPGGARHMPVVVVGYPVAIGVLHDGGGEPATNSSTSTFTFPSALLVFSRLLHVRLRILFFFAFAVCPRRFAWTRAERLHRADDGNTTATSCESVSSRAVQQRGCDLRKNQ